MEVELKSFYRRVKVPNGTIGYLMYSSGDNSVIMANVPNWPFPKMFTMPTKDVKFVKSLKEIITVDVDEALL